MQEVDCGKQSSHITKSNTQLTNLVCGYYFITASGLSLRAGGRGFPPVTQNITPGYFRR